MSLATIVTKLKTVTDNNKLRWTLGNPAEVEDNWEAWATLGGWTITIDPTGYIAAQYVGGSYIPGGTSTDLLASVKTQIANNRATAITQIEAALDALIAS